MYACAASFCHNTRYMVKRQNANITFHTFPVDKSVCSKWIEFCQQHETWTPSKRSIICSDHFKPEDYQMSQLPMNQRRGDLCRLHATAVPSITINNSFNKIEMDSSEETHEVKSDIDQPMNPIVLKYRDQICRTCMNPCSKDSSVSIYSQLHNITVLDMIIQLTAFETEHNEAYPTVICFDCKQKLEIAYIIRKEFIMQTELLVQLVAEDSIKFYIKKAGIEESNNLTDSKPFVGTIFSDTFNSGQETQDVPDDGPPQQPVFADQREKSELNDHASYAKVLGQCEDSNALVEDRLAEESVNQVKPIYIRKSRQEESYQLLTLPAKNIESGKLNVHGLRNRVVKVQRVASKNVTNGLRSKRSNIAPITGKTLPFTTCYVCDTKHDSILELDFHMREHFSMLPYHCNECNSPVNSTDDNKEQNADSKNVVLKTTNQLNTHFRMHRMPHKCEKCNHRFSGATKLKYHFLAVHTHGEHEFTCEYCGKQYYHSISFNKHIEKHRNEQSGQFKCTICDRSFGVKSSLQRHEASHTGEKKFKCMYCYKSFSTSYNRLAHQRTHTGERPYKCLDCGLTFSLSSTLKTHQETLHCDESSSEGKVSKTKTRNFPAEVVCPYAGCGYKAKKYAAMYAHKRTKHKPTHQCEVCHRSFAFANQLKTHMMLHTGEKPYKCEECHRKFRLIKDYRWHIETHNSETRHICSICQKTFKLQRYLQAHLLTHSMERSFACNLCGSSYKTKGELKKHTEQKHADVIADLIAVKTIPIEVDYCFSDIMEENKFMMDI